jgi:hypothetical protein
MLQYYIIFPSNPVKIYISIETLNWGARGGAIDLRHCAASRKVAGSIPAAVFGIFH